MNSRYRLAVLTTVVLAALAGAGCLVVLVPIGEAPDEPAHLAYVDHVLRYGNLPAVSQAPAWDRYESFQPPLAYVLMAFAVDIAGFRDIGYEFVGDPGFGFERGTRAFFEPAQTPAAGRSRRAARVARAVNLLWLVVIEAMILATCLRVAASFAAAMASALPFCLAPQLLFTCASASNDAAVIALASVAVLGSLVLVTEDRERPMTAAIVSLVSGLALWAKVSAVFLVPALAIAVVVSARARRWRTVAALLVPGLALSVAWVLLSWTRAHSVVPLPAAHLGNPGGLARLFVEPWWLVSVWTGFWAKLGWFNLSLPKLFYLAFLPASLSALVGLVAAILAPRLRSSANLLLILAVTANGCLLLAYMVRVDWQPQGRYLLPSVAAAAGLCALGSEWLGQRTKTSVMARVALGSAAGSVLVAVATLWVVAANY